MNTTEIILIISTIIIFGLIAYQSSLISNLLYIKNRLENDLEYIEKKLNNHINDYNPRLLNVNDIFVFTFCSTLIKVKVIALSKEGVFYRACNADTNTIPDYIPFSILNKDYNFRRVYSYNY